MRRDPRRIAGAGSREHDGSRVGAESGGILQDVHASFARYRGYGERAIELQLRHAQSQEVLIAVDGPDVVGYANIYLPPPDASAPRVRVTIQVPPEYRKRGIGSALTDTITERAVELGAGRLLVVVASPPLNSFSWPL